MIEDYYRNTVPLKPGVEDFLRRLWEHGVKMCVATVTSGFLADAALRRLGVRGYFSGVFTCGSGGAGKEEPHIYRKALEHLQTEKGETIVFEDAFYAIKTAKADGFLVAGVYDCHESQGEEARGLVDCYIQDYREAQDFWRYGGF